MNLLRQLVLGGALYLVPAFALAGWLAGTALTRWSLAFALSPVLLGLLALPLRYAGLPPMASGLWALGFCTLAAIVRLRATPALPPGEERAALVRAAWLVPIVLLPALFNPYLLVRSDAWFHAAVTAQAQLLPLPPQDPYFAGLKLQYFWFFHHVLSLYAAVAHVGPFVAMWLFNGACFGLTLLAVYRLARAVGSSHAGALWSYWFVAAGANALGWGWILVHVVKSAHGWADLVPHLPDYALNLVSWRYTSSATAFSLDKFMVGTAFSWGLMYFAWWAALSADFWERGGRAVAIQSGLLVGAALLIHSVAGFTAGWAGALAVGLALLARPSARALQRGLGLGACMAAAVALTYPYLHSVTQSKAQGGLPHVGPNPSMAWTTLWVTAGFLPFLLLSLPALWKAGDASRWTLLLAVALAAVSCFLTINYGNEGKFLHITLLPLSALAGPCARAWLTRVFPERPAARVATMVGLFVPTTAFVLVCLAASHGTASLRPERAGPGPGERRTYDWVSRNTPPGAVLLAEPGSLQALVRAQRAQVWSLSPYDILWGYAPSDIAPRREAVTHAFSGGLTPADVAFLSSLHRPVYRVAREGTLPSSPRFELQHREGDWVAERINLAEVP